MTTISRRVPHLDFAKETATAKRRAAKSALPGRYDKSRRNKSGRETAEFRIIFLLTFVFFLFAAIIERLMPWRWLAQGDERKRHTSVFKEAWRAAGTCTTYAFMG
jgi:hypothetical protein